MARSGRIRIIGGNLRNSRLNVPDLPGLRPTPERVRQTLFDWLAPAIAGARALDLCAGTGALGIEALSRGAAWVQFVESDRFVAQALRENLDRLKAQAAEVTVMDALHFLRRRPAPFTLTFLDPPFALQLWTPLARQLEQGGWLAKGAHVYVESPHGQILELPSNWLLHREGRAGNLRYALYRRSHDVPLS